MLVTSFRKMAVGQKYRYWLALVNWLNAVELFNFEPHPYDTLRHSFVQISSGPPAAPVACPQLGSPLQVCGLRNPVSGPDF